MLAGAKADTPPLREIVTRSVIKSRRGMIELKSVSFGGMSYPMVYMTPPVTPTKFFHINRNITRRRKITVDSYHHVSQSHN